MDKIQQSKAIKRNPTTKEVTSMIDNYNSSNRKLLQKNQTLQHVDAMSQQMAKSQENKSRTMKDHTSSGTSVKKIKTDMHQNLAVSISINQS